jgi:hypothetical protein
MRFAATATRARCAPLPQPNWPDLHAPKVPTLIEMLERRPGFATVKLAWASGLMLVVRQP